MLRDIIDHHLRGTRFGIGVDPADGLLRQGADGYQLTWMDAKVGDWVVTPRRGKAVEINALWYNALRLLAGWLARGRDEPARPPRSTTTPIEPATRSTSASGCAERGYLYDVIDGEGRATTPRCGRIRCSPFRCRIRCSTKSVGRAVLDVVDRATADADGPALARAGRAATTSRATTAICAPATPPIIRGPSGPWLIGPFIDAWLKVHPDQIARGPRISRRLRRPSRRGLHRLDQRNLRRRSPLHAARLHRPGLERRRSAALLGAIAVGLKTLPVGSILIKKTIRPHQPQA